MSLPTKTWVQVNPKKLHGLCTRTEAPWSQISGDCKLSFLENSIRPVLPEFNRRDEAPHQADISAVGSTGFIYSGLCFYF